MMGSSGLSLRPELANCWTNVYIAGININGIIRRQARVIPRRPITSFRDTRVMRVNFQRSTSPCWLSKTRYIADYGILYTYEQQTTVLSVRRMRRIVHDAPSLQIQSIEFASIIANNSFTFHTCKKRKDTLRISTLVVSSCRRTK